MIEERLIANFLKISKIPRQSGQEERIANYLISVAKSNKLYFYKDDDNNVLIKKKGNIQAPPIALQTHLDMVCVKRQNSNHDFEKNGIKVVIKDDKVTASGTSLGADQGVGLAIMLTILEDTDLKHPDLEFIFTTEEETTFNGCVKFPYYKLNSKRLINLDGDKDDTIFIGAYGDICNEYVYHGDIIKTNMPSYKVVIDGFLGGNSGNEVELAEKNAITTMAKLLKDKDILIQSIKGGTTENDIATACEVVINTNKDIKEIFKGVIAKITNIDNKYVFSKEDTSKIINQILQLQCGYISPNKATANLGVVSTNENEVRLQYIFRSLDKTEIEELNKFTRELDNNFTINEIYRDSIWEINTTSKLLQEYKDIYFGEYLQYPKESVIMGGSECSAIKSRIEDLDIISIGSNIENIHSVNETTYISSWIKIYNLLVKLLAISER